jgi:hypothetical protein
MRHDRDQPAGFDPAIPDMGAYEAGMRRSLIDKAFFLDKIDADLIVDYGCADGALLGFVRHLFPETRCVGYDISQEQLGRAREAVPGILVTDDWELVRAACAEVGPDRVAVVANSLMHEVYSYGGREDVERFWTRIFDPTCFGTVVIRDMCVSRTTSRASDPLSVMKVRQRYDRNAIDEFEQQWGSLGENWSLTHFLLKYRYRANWGREVRENYLPVNLEDLMARVPAAWTPSYVEHFTLPFIREQVRRDFSLELQDRTHVKLILRHEG